MPKKIILIGATGSLGRQTIDVALSMPERFEIVALSAHTDETGLLAAASRLEKAGRATAGACRIGLCLSGIEPVDARIEFHGRSGLKRLIRERDADMLVNAAAGAGGLEPSMAALESGKDLALANKESVVMAWPLLSAAAARKGRFIIPVDSEHAALFQLINQIGKDRIEEVLITASGGPFRDRPLDELALVKAAEAAAHPVWNMGRKISIDSATMANKGLEVIEASRLFSLPPAAVKVLIHPQSLVHALVRGIEGGLYAQLSLPDMRLPIQNALAWPELLPCPFGRLELAGRSLDFQAPDPRRYPLLGLAYQALAAGDGACIAYNAADEIAVAAYEAGRIGFLDIATIVEKTLNRDWPSRALDIGAIFELDGAAREMAAAALAAY